MSLQQAEEALKAAEQESNPDNYRILDRLEALAAELRKEKRLLEAVNIEARANSLRQKITPSDIIHPPEMRPKPEHICRFCKEQIHAQASKCKHCGSEFSSPSGVVKGILGAIGFGALGLGFLGSLFFLLFFSAVAPGSETVNLGLIADKLAGEIFCVGLAVIGACLIGSAVH